MFTLKGGCEEEMEHCLEYRKPRVDNTCALSSTLWTHACFKRDAVLNEKDLDNEVV